MTEASKPVVVFRALQLANEQRNAYGLRYNDHARYRKHCGNRAHRLRSSLKMTHGKGRDFKKLPPLTLETIRDGHLQLLLFEAERAWAYSVELNTQSLLPANSDKAGTLRHSATGRFRRAVNWSTQLLSHCQSLYGASRLSAENLLEVTIYTLILNGRFLRYREEFDDALVQLAVARSLLNELTVIASTSRDQALATSFSDEIAPEIRYSAHELGHTKAYDVDGIVTSVAAKHRNRLVEGCDALLAQFKTEDAATAKAGTRGRLRELIWEGQPVPVRNPELVDVLLKVQEAGARLEGRDVDSGAAAEKKKAPAHLGSKKGVAAYDNILAALSDAEDVARKLMEAQQHQGSGAASTSTAAPGGTRDLHFVHAYIVYQLLSRRIQRDLLLLSALLASSQDQRNAKSISAKIKPEQVDARLYPAVVKLLDSVLQSLEQMKALSIVDDSPDLASAIEARSSYTKARRCLYLARCYAPLKRFAEALVLIQHAHIHIRETGTSLSLLPPSIPQTAPTDPSSVNPAYFLLNTTDVESFQADINADALHYKRDWFAFNGGAAIAETGEGSIGHKKPLFFNIALNYVELDMDTLLVRAGKQPLLATAKATAAPVPAPPPITKAPSQVARKADPASLERKAIEEVRPSTPKPSANVQAKGGLGNLLGGWWGKS
ncbi:hypothetical protein BDN72DRAFT_806631 [Pluteus cervinus]|uniref:Uncharacterized protein n=1 Tax=Pluteus cervinus TaxID=181527 RepID=A0ACD3BF32_9AGAR|nr:hypothetical protein BDN72DRAFT_806631 [Pluteus cervinus]